MLEKNLFYALTSMLEGGDRARLIDRVSGRAGLAPEAAEGALEAAVAAGFATPELAVSPAGLEALAPHRVRNAVIMAAGLSSRFAPLCYERPKGLLTVRGEVLIERQIRQLRQAGIADITVVVGYMKERFLYLAERFGVSIAVNDDYYRYNNTSTLMAVLDRLDNTYICSSDNYFESNVFEPYVYDAYYAAVQADAPTGEWCMETDADDRITAVNFGGPAGSWYMLGHAYFSRAFSRRFAALLAPAFRDDPQVRDNLWEWFFRAHLDALPMAMRRYGPGVIFEFDSLDELRAFDPRYLKSSGSAILDNIARVLGCEESDARDFTPIKAGLTNTSFHFEVKGRRYVYRHPGAGTAGFIHRDSEFDSMAVAQRLGLDGTYIAMDPVAGWKISRYVEGAHTLDYHDEAEVRQALSLMRRLHDANLRSAHDFGIWCEILKFRDRVRDAGRAAFEDFDDLFELLRAVRDRAEADGVEKRLCHCDCYAPNFLVDGQGRMHLIDWEYSGNDDPGCDLGTFVCCSDYTQPEALRVLELYHGHPPTPPELRHDMAYIAIASYYWFLWAIHQDSLNNPVGDYLALWHRGAGEYGRRALALYQARGD